ncbi:MAG TPA: NAD(P)/FAD-dependent oxidoreductase [Candidatus Acidoferrales bacterium]|nr:NAD(P)/FAD-dependent oxidoreductase [Candidatus Acidoferrales bacterium]
MSADVLIVGGGPAGLAAAIAARMKNLRVAVIDPRHPPIDKPCGEGLLPEAVAALRILGIQIDSSIAAPFAGFRFSDDSSSASARISRGKAFGLRRTALHQLLVDRAAELGVSLLWGSRLSSLDSHHVAVDGHLFPCKWIVGADGQNSSVRQSARLGQARYRPSRFGFRLHYAVAPWTDLVEVHWGEKSQMIVTPTSANEICISLFSHDSHLRIGRALDQFPEVAVHLRGVRPISAEAGAVTSLGRARAVVRGNVALVGDAGCMVDAVLGQGLSLAFQQALHLADALASEDLARYEIAHRRLTRVPIRMTRLMLLMNASTALRRKVLRLFAARPALFAKMISIHTGNSESDALNAAQILDLGWRVLFA